MKMTCKLCRREGTTLCGREKCAFKRRSYAPGVQGKAKKQSRPSVYGQQLREKQKAKRFYQIMERQFRNYFEKALQKKGNTGDYLVQLLEERLDNVVYRLGLGKTRAQARQMISHGFIEVNQKKVTIPSFSVHINDEIRIKTSKQKKGLLQDLSERLQKQQKIPQWLYLDKTLQTGKVVSRPDGEDLKQPFDSTLIVGLYSR